MDRPMMFEPRSVAVDTDSLPAYIPVPGYGVLPVNAFLIRAAQPVLVDSGLASLREGFMQSLRSAVALDDLRWIWLTHMDPDHFGNLEAVLAEAPKARVVTTFLGMGKMGLHQLPLDRVYLLNPGQSLDIGDRRLVAVTPPAFDAPETTGLFDTKTRAFFSADCFGALMNEPAETAAEIPPGDLRDGLVAWSTVDAPWLRTADEDKFDHALDAVSSLAPSVVLSSHLPAANGMTETLLCHLSSALAAPAFEGPDQAALEQMMAA
ncbi:MBL fold metallo-hydrolase [Rhodospirillaceae bacterium SYSU D60014]|uniref:MBL fold metallo-hydrolase n=1 Tax=Virgifigura deserti TaxID=2268457 RepID=UPI000E675D23